MSLKVIRKYKVMDNVGLRSDAGRLFQTRGPLTAKNWSPNVVLVNGTSSNFITT